MGYTTEFQGTFNLSREATNEEINYINTFSSTRRMKRNPEILMSTFKGKHGMPNFPKLTYIQKKQIEALEKSGLKISYSNDSDNRTAEEIYGIDGAYFAMNDGASGQTRDKSVIDFNTPPGQLFGSQYDFYYLYNENKRLASLSECQPGLWCDWQLTEDGKKLKWNGGEKFYEYTNWLKYMIEHFFKPWGIILNGEVKWQGESSDDMGIIICENNNVFEKKAKIIYE